MVNDFFEKWFAPLEYATGGLLDKGKTMEDFPNEEEFAAAYPSTTVPREHIKIIYRAIKQPNEDWNSSINIERRSALADRLQQCPTWDEYKQAVRCAKLNSSGGPTGCTYNMLKALPDNASRAMYDEMVRLWGKKTIPAFWKNSWLCPIPKKSDNPELKDLRPLRLCEVTRKIWVGIILYRLVQFWEKNETLHQSQHAYSRSSSTDHAIAQVLAALETTEENVATAAIASWDFEKAFDSPSKKNLETIMDETRCSRSNCCLPGKHGHGWENGTENPILAKSAAHQRIQSGLQHTRE